MDLEPLFDRLQKTANSKLEQFCRGTKEEYCVYIPLNQKAPDIVVEIYDISRQEQSPARKMFDRIVGHMSSWVKRNLDKNAMAPPQNVVDYVMESLPVWAGKKNGAGLNFRLHPSIKVAPDSPTFHVPEQERPPELEIS